MKTVPEMLRECAETYEQRNALYKDNYKKFGAVMQALFAGGFEIKTDADFNRLGMVVQIVGKLTRYTVNFNNGGHDDSLLDLSVYAQMLRELDNEQRAAADKAWDKPPPKEVLARIKAKRPDVEVGRPAVQVAPGHVSREEVHDHNCRCTTCWNERNRRDGSIP